jgi:hypothetical protein
MLSEPILVVARIVQAFDAMGIQYVVGGSLASSIYGVPRATQDVDFVADLKAPDAAKLEQLLSGEFYVDADMIRDAIVKRASFNVIHLATMFKADVFVMKRDAWSREEMSRARPEQRACCQSQLRRRRTSFLKRKEAFERLAQRRCPTPSCSRRGHRFAQPTQLNSATLDSKRRENREAAFRTSA